MIKNQILYALTIFSFILFVPVKYIFANEYMSYGTSDVFEEFAELFNQAELQKNTSYKISSAIVADNCLVFLNKNDFLGPLGRAVSKNFVEHNTSLPHLINGGEINNYCHRYATMSLQQKSLVWVLILAVVAHYESSCQPKARAQGPNGAANGLYQLHLGFEQDYDGGQNTCDKNSSSNPEQSSRCALGMLDFQLQKWQGHLFNNKSYWDVLRPNGASHRALDIQKALTHSNFCNPQSI